MAFNEQELKQRIPGWGADADPRNRPGVPMELDPPKPAQGAHWQEPERQEATVEVLKRVGLDQLTPIFGTRQPPRGLSGWLRRYAYANAEDKTRRWMTLLVADRVDVVESLLTEHPLVLGAALAGLAAGWLALSRGPVLRGEGEEEEEDYPRLDRRREITRAARAG